MIGGSVDATSAELKNKMLQRCWGWDYKAPCIYYTGGRAACAPFGFAVGESPL